jgi:sterol desaturase/sphingolipid hydroxylase (fatty acid hydroxylase superfamily)
MFNHSNLGLPRAVDQILRAVIVTPDMHRIHHSRNHTEHNKNFGFNFSFWDRMLGTYLEAPEGSQESMPLGIDGFAGKTTRSIPALLKQPLLAPSIDKQ